HRFARERRELRDDLPTLLAAHQDAAARPRIADAGTDLARAPALVGRQVGEIGPVSLAGVDDVVLSRAHGGEHALDRLYRRAGEREIVAHGIDIAALAAEIGLHVDDDERRVFGTQFAIIGPRIRIGGDETPFAVALDRAQMGDAHSAASACVVT